MESHGRNTHAIISVVNIVRARLDVEILARISVNPAVPIPIRSHDILDGDGNLS